MTGCVGRRQLSEIRFFAIRIYGSPIMASYVHLRGMCVDSGQDSHALKSPESFFPSSSSEASSDDEASAVVREGEQISSCLRRTLLLCCSTNDVFSFLIGFALGYAIVVIDDFLFNVHHHRSRRSSIIHPRKFFVQRKGRRIKRVKNSDVIFKFHLLGCITKL